MKKGLILIQATMLCTTHELYSNAAAVLYEGYLLYPYRPSSVKNRQRWTFGGLFPRDCDLARSGAELRRLGQCEGRGGHPGAGRG